MLLGLLMPKHYRAMNIRGRIVGEIIGTYLLVFFGCSSVATAVLFGAQVGIFQIAMVWGIGLSLAIFLTAGMSGAHLNPAMTITFAVFGGFSWKYVPIYILSQAIGAFVAAATIYLLFFPYFGIYEESLGVIRGEVGSEATAMIFGEFFPDPGGKPIDPSLLTSATFRSGFLAEFLGTALLSFGIFGIIDPVRKKMIGRSAPIAIGGLLVVLISLFAPLSQGGFNPARDFAPRLFASLAGWGDIPFVTNGQGWWLVYIIAPILGALFGAFAYKRLMATSLV